MTALDHLRRLTKDNPNPYCCSCVFCGDSRGSDDDHTPDCPWVAAKKFADEQPMNSPDHLKALLARGCNATSETDWAPQCFYCGAEAIHESGTVRIRSYAHDPACPWVAAKRFADETVTHTSPTAPA